MLRVLWLCSWYPNEVSPYDGDFVQRHARVTSNISFVDVINVVNHPGIRKAKEMYQTYKEWPNLTERIIYYPYRTQLFKKLASFFRWQQLYKKAIKKYIEENGKPDLVHVHVTFKAGYIGRWIQKKYGIHYVITERWTGYTNIVKGNSYHEKPLWHRYLIQLSWKRATALHTPTRFLANAIVNRGFKADTIAIFNMVDTNLFKYEARNQDRKIVFAHISNGAKFKNLDKILEVYSSISAPDTELQIIGLDPEVEEQYRKKYNHVKFLGVLSYAEVASVIRSQVDCLIVYSEVETFSNVTAEALCCGVPVIATKNGGIAELLDDANSIKVDPGDNNTLKNALEYYIQNRDKFNREMIAKKAHANFAIDIIAAKMKEWYLKVIS